VDIPNALSELGKRLGIGPIELDAHNGCLLAFDDDLIVDIEIAEDEPGFFLSAAVGEVPRAGREAIFAELLEANLQGRGAGRSCLALDGDLDEIVLCRYVDRNEIDIQTLEEELEMFLQTLAVWRQRHGRGELGSLRGGAGPELHFPVEGMIRG
jgi:Tir chaperone protein (CesT) family